MMDQYRPTAGLSRRTFLTTTSAALLGTAMGGLVPQSEAAQHPPNAVAYCSLVRVLMLLASTRTGISSITSPIPLLLCTPA